MKKFLVPVQIDDLFVYISDIFVRSVKLPRVNRAAIHRDMAHLPAEFTR